VTSSCYLVEHGETAVLLDIGHGSFAALAAYRDPASIDAVFVTHLHPDHHIDLVPLRHYLRYGRPEPSEVAMHAPADLRARYDALLGEEGFLSGLPGAAVEPGTRAVGSLSIEAGRVTHTESSYAFRVTVADGDPATPGLVYSGDCGRTADLLALLGPGDTLLSEASFGTGEPIEGVLHLTAAEAGRAARDGGASRLVLTHVLDEGDPEGAVAAARRAFAGEVLLAVPGLTLEV
jgi:ribonuclease BN (tRNA processing enzyme)